MLTLQELLNGVKCLDENTLAELSDKLWELGTLDDIKEKVNNAKAKTIEKFLGKDFKVLSSYGHIRDLKKKDFSIDI